MATRSSRASGNQRRKTSLTRARKRYFLSIALKLGLLVAAVALLVLKIITWSQAQLLFRMLQ